jgi:hypothetical protein
LIRSGTESARQKVTKYVHPSLNRWGRSPLQLGVAIGSERGSTIRSGFKGPVFFVSFISCRISHPLNLSHIVGQPSRLPGGWESIDRVHTTLPPARETRAPQSDLQREPGRTHFRKEN